MMPWPIASDTGFIAFFALLGVVVIAVVTMLGVRSAVRKRTALQTEVESLRRRVGRGSAVQVLLDEHEIKQACLKLREGAAEIRGSWCSRYKRDEIVAYFQQEHSDLMTNRDLIVHRTVNPNVVGEAWDEFYDLWSRSDAKARWKIKLNSTISDAELLHVRYADGRSPVGVMVINEVRETAIASDPAVGLIFDPSEERWLRHGVNFIERWLEQISNDPKSKPLTRHYTRTWGGSVPRAYDRSVWKNPDLPEFFKGYLREEQRMLIDLVDRCANESANRVTLVEVGCGTARAMIRCATPDLVNKMQYIIGFDASAGMLKEAENNLREAIAEHEGADELEILHRVRFTLLDALAMNLHFSEGSLLSPQGSHFPGIGLKWAPEGDVETYEVDQMAYFDSRKVFCCMLNTLGVFSDEQRLVVLENMVRAMREGDYLALSLLDGDIFSDGARLFYSSIRDVTQATDEQEKYEDNIAVFRTTGDPPYWSRWLFDAPNPGRAVPEAVTVEGLLHALKASFGDEASLVTEVHPIEILGDGETVGHFVVIRRER
jgi:hypothetical protein